jgi:hypothetical protein
MARPAILSFLRSETSSRDPFEVRGRPLAVNEKRVVLGVEDSFLEVVPGKALDDLERVPERDGDEFLLIAARAVEDVEP